MRPAKHVLLIEDHEDTRIVLTRLLIRQGFIVYARASVEEALEREQEYKALDMAILDVVLPGIQGDEYGSRLRKLSPRLPIVFMTASLAISEIRKRVPDAQILIKPVDIGSVLASFIY